LVGTITIRTHLWGRMINGLFGETA
jgi:hypothetical protein